MNKTNKTKLEVISNENESFTNTEILEGIISDYEKLMDRITDKDSFISITRTIEPNDEKSFKDCKKFIEDRLEQTIRKEKGSNHILTTTQELKFNVSEDVKKYYEVFEDMYINRSFKRDDITESFLNFLKKFPLNKETQKWFSKKVPYQTLICNTQYSIKVNELDYIHSYVTNYGFKKTGWNKNSYNSYNYHNRYIPFEYSLFEMSKLLEEMGYEKSNENYYDIIREILDSNDRTYGFMEEVLGIEDPRYNEKFDEKTFYKNINSLDKSLLYSTLSEFNSEIKSINEILDIYYSEVTIDFSEFLDSIEGIIPILNQRLDEIKIEEDRKSGLVRKKVNVDLTFNLDMEIDSLDDDDLKKKIINGVERQINMNLNFGCINNFGGWGDFFEVKGEETKLKSVSFYPIEKVS